jgi:beta-galactosidase
VASGATGYNIYTGVGTKHSALDLDAMHPDEYPDSAPIDGEGRLTPKADTVRSLNEFFNRRGSEFLETLPVRNVAFGIYLPYAHSAVWVAEQEWEQATVLGIPNHGQVLLKFQQLCLANQQDFDLVNLQVVEEDHLRSHPTLVLASGRWMDGRTQEKLRSYVLGGGRLILVGEIPQLNEDFQPISILAEMPARIHVIRSSDFCGWAAADWEKQVVQRSDIIPLNQAASKSYLWHYSHPELDIDYLFVFSGKETSRPLEFQFGTRGRTHTVRLTLPSTSAGVIRIQNGAITDILAKGKNEEADEEVIIECRLDQQILSAHEPGDWVFSKR